MRSDAPTQPGSPHLSRVFSFFSLLTCLFSWDEIEGIRSMKDLQPFVSSSSNWEQVLSVAKSCEVYKVFSRFGCGYTQARSRSA